MTGKSRPLIVATGAVMRGTLGEIDLPAQADIADVIATLVHAGIKCGPSNRSVRISNTFTSPRFPMACRSRCMKLFLLQLRGETAKALRSQGEPI
jgi:hypothetical protein